MVVSPYRTQLTRMIQDGDKNPERNMTNYRTLHKPSRHAAWLAKNNKK